LRDNSEEIYQHSISNTIEHGVIRSDEGTRREEGQQSSVSEGLDMDN